LDNAEKMLTFVVVGPQVKKYEQVKDFVCVAARGSIPPRDTDE
jgi:hypothetical protein